MTDHNISLSDIEKIRGDALFFNLNHDLGQFRWNGKNEDGEFVNQPYLLLSQPCSLSFYVMSKPTNASNFSLIIQPTSGVQCDVEKDKPIYFSPNHNSVYIPNGESSLKGNSASMVIQYVTVWGKESKVGCTCKLSVALTKLDDGEFERVNLIGSSYSIS